MHIRDHDIITQPMSGLAALTSTCSTQNLSCGAASFLVFTFVKKVLLWWLSILLLVIHQHEAVLNISYILMLVSCCKVVECNIFQYCSGFVTHQLIISPLQLGTQQYEFPCSFYEVLSGKLSCKDIKILKRSGDWLHPRNTGEF